MLALQHCDTLLPSEQSRLRGLLEPLARPGSQGRFEKLLDRFFRGAGGKDAEREGHSKLRRSLSNFVAASFALSYFFAFASLATLLLLPDQKDEAQFRKRTWPAKGRYAAITVALVAVALAYSLAVNLLSMFESTMCLRFAGGDGCEEAPVATAAAPH